MVKSEEFKKCIESKLTQDYKIEFLGNNFNQIVELLTESKAEKIYNWIGEVISKKIQPIFIGSDKQYKEWKINDLLTFRYPFVIDKNEYRILFVKVKNAIYIEFHLGDHKYYDKIRKELEMK